MNVLCNQGYDAVFVELRDEMICKVRNRQIKKPQGFKGFLCGTCRVLHRNDVNVLEKGMVYLPNWSAGCMACHRKIYPCERPPARPSAYTWREMETMFRPPVSMECQRSVCGS